MHVVIVNFVVSQMFTKAITLMAVFSKKYVVLHSVQVMQ